MSLSELIPLLALVVTNLVAVAGIVYYMASTLGKRIGDLDKRIDGLDERMDGLDKRIDDLNSNMNARFNDVNARIDDLRTQMNREHDTLSRKVDTLTTPSPLTSPIRKSTRAREFEQALPNALIALKGLSSWDFYRNHYPFA